MVNKNMTLLITGQRSQSRHAGESGVTSEPIAIGAGNARGRRDCSRANTASGLAVVAEDGGMVSRHGHKP